MLNNPQPTSGASPEAPPPPQGCRYPSRHNCSGQYWKARRFIQSNGVTVARYQCDRCGLIHVTPGFKRSMLPADAPLVDQQADKETWHHFNPDPEIRLAEARRFYEQNPAWQANDEPFYESAEWQSIRLKKLSLHPICEGCGEAPATQCHHASYRRKRTPLLFELRALCDSCHDRVHSRISSDSSLGG